MGKGVIWGGIKKWRRREEMMMDGNDLLVGIFDGVGKEVIEM